MKSLQSSALLFFVLFILSDCNSGGVCKYRPAPIFGEGLPYVVQYHYEVNGRQSMESLMLETGVLLDVYQDVCDATRQEYRFTVPGKAEKYRAQADSTWMMEATRQLVFLSTLSPQQAPLKAWADVIEASRAGMKLGEDFEVQEGITIRIDRVIAEDNTTLLLVFSQE
jgi:hypothetical protein